MNTTALSEILTHVGAITDLEVSELEKLAESAPYCQTAHVLIAKALHDRGSLLAGARLRRAATHAADRRVLRRLLLTPAEPDEVVAAASAVVAAPALATEAPVEAGASQLPETEVPTLAVSASGELVPTAGDSPAQEEPTAEEVDHQPEAEAAVVAATEAPSPAVSATPEVELEKEEDLEAATEPVSMLGLPPETVAAPSATVEAEAAAEVPAPEAPATWAEPLVLVPPGAEVPVQEEPLAEPTGPVLVDLDLVPQISSPAFDLFLFEPAVAVEPAANVPLLPVDEVATVAAPVVRVPTLEVEAAIRYALTTGGSRLGEELVAADLWPPAAADLTTAVPQQLRPDARWTEHLALHQPPAAEPALHPFEHQFALIERFLREKPRMRAFDPTRLLPDKQPDLAQQSAQAADGALVSESMARILARQGKTTRAIGMYEQLRVKFPEKSAYFAEQIAFLRAK